MTLTDYVLRIRGPADGVFTLSALGGSFGFTGSAATLTYFSVTTPTISAAVNGTTVTLTTSAYASNQPSSAHLATRWQVTTAADTGFASPTHDSGVNGDSENLTSLVLSGHAEGDFIARAQHLGGDAP